MPYALSPHLRSWGLFGLLVIFVIVISVGGACAPAVKSGQQEIAANTRPTQNGIYAVVKEAATRKAAQDGDAHRTVLAYDKKYILSDPNDPLMYVAIDPSSFVPLILEGSPVSTKDAAGKTILSATLKKEYVKTLEDFTRAQLGGEIAIVLDGEVVTLHKVRNVVSGGKFQITRCKDDACTVLQAKLTE